MNINRSPFSVHSHFGCPLASLRLLSFWEKEEASDKNKQFIQIHECQFLKDLIMIKTNEPWMKHWGLEDCSDQLHLIRLQDIEINELCGFSPFFSDLLANRAFISSISPPLPPLVRLASFLGPEELSSGCGAESRFQGLPPNVNFSSASVRFKRDNAVISWTSEARDKNKKLVPYSLDTTQFGSGDHSSETRRCRGFVPLCTSSYGQWRREGRLGCPCWWWRRAWRRWWGRRAAHVHCRRYYWRGHRKHGRVALERRTWKKAHVKKST